MRLVNGLKVEGNYGNDKNMEGLWEKARNAAFYIERESCGLKRKRCSSLREVKGCIYCACFVFQEIYS